MDKTKHVNCTCRSASWLYVQAVLMQDRIMYDPKSHQASWEARVLKSGAYARAFPYEYGLAVQTQDD